MLHLLIEFSKLLDNILFIKLFHHTLSKFKDSIIIANYFKCSAWNYQGTKKLTNYEYCYFTSLPRIDKPSDLHKIAMSSNGKIQLIVDGTDEIIDIVVYRDSTENRTATMEFLIDTTTIENNGIIDKKEAVLK